MGCISTYIYPHGADQAILTQGMHLVLHPHDEGFPEVEACHILQGSASRNIIPKDQISRYIPRESTSTKVVEHVIHFFFTSIDFNTVHYTSLLAIGYLLVVKDVQPKRPLLSAVYVLNIIPVNRDYKKY